MFNLPWMAGLNFESFQRAMSDYVDPDTLETLNQKYFPLLQAEISQYGSEETQPSPLLERRFKSEAWLKKPILLSIANLYSIYKQYTFDLISATRLDDFNQSRIRYVTTQWLEASSPANFFATNAEAQERFLTTQGKSLQDGMLLFFKDLVKGRISQTDEQHFEVGKNLATSPGKVIYRDDLMELIQYTPSTKEVYKRPLLIVPPCINKFYILDLEPQQSFVKHAVDQGYQVFLISWKNIEVSQANLDWDQYVQTALNAHEIVQQISQESSSHMVGFCVGGTLLATAASVLAKQKRSSEVASLTLLTTLLDFKDPGVLGIFTDTSHVQWQESLTQAESGSIVPAKQLNALFNSLRPADLIWNYVENSYLKGVAPAAFDILYWNSDSTNLPGKMVSTYLRKLYLENQLCQPNTFNCLGQSLDLGKINVPVYALATKEDHIVPWMSAYRSFYHLLTKNNAKQSRFVLAASGHIAGVVNSPTVNRRQYWTNSGTEHPFPETASQWQQHIKETAGSWWSDWYQWLHDLEDKDKKKAKKNAPKQMGSKDFPPLLDAPGEYVKVRAM